MKIYQFTFFILLFPILSFAQPNTLKFDIKYEIISNDCLTVEDTANHFIGKAAGTGAVIFADGSQGTVKVFFIYDYINGNGNFTEYYDITMLADTSKLTVQAKGHSVGSSQDGSSPLFTGAVTITGGSGKFEGIYGTGSVTGNRNKSLEYGAKVKMSFNIQLQ
jgi:hypothetical protein